MRPSARAASSCVAGELHARLVQGAGKDWDRVEGLGHLAEHARDVGRDHTLREQLAGAPVAAVRGEDRRDEVSGAGRAGKALALAPRDFASAWHSA